MPPQPASEPGLHRRGRFPVVWMDAADALEVPAPMADYSIVREEKLRPSEQVLDGRIAGN